MKKSKKDFSTKKSREKVNMDRNCMIYNLQRKGYKNLSRLNKSDLNDIYTLEKMNTENVNEPKHELVQRYILRKVEVRKQARLAKQESKQEPKAKQARLAKQEPKAESKPKYDISKFLNDVNSDANAKKSVSIDLQPPQTTDDLKSLLSKIDYTPNHKMVMKMNVGGQEKFYTLSRKFMRKMKKIADGKIIKRDQHKSQGSDEEVYDSIINEKINNFTLRAVNTNMNKNLFRRGDLFKYTHNVPIDLSRYQIYQNIEEIPKDLEPCLIHTFRMSGLFTDEELEMMSKYVDCENLPEHKIKTIADKFNFGFKIMIDMKENDKTRSKIRTKYELNRDKVITICQLDEHYFIYDEKTDITSFALKNYEKLQDLTKWQIITRFKSKNEHIQRKKNQTINSFKLVKILLSNKEKFLKRIDFNEVLEHKKAKNRHSRKDDNNDDLVYLDSDVKQIEFKKPNHDFSNRDKFNLVFFDTETITLNDDGTPKDKHEAYQIISNTNEAPVNECFEGRLCALAFLQSIKKDSLLICHNLKYDSSFLYPYLYNINECSRGGRIITISAMFYNKDTRKSFKLYFKDSYNMISEKLANFPAIFNLGEMKKEVMPYGLYTYVNIYSNTKNKKWVKIDKARDHLTEDDFETFENNINELNLTGDKGRFRIWAYSRYYCNRDVDIMRNGYMMFRKWVNEITGLDILNYATISSIGYAFANKEGCFKDCFELGGNIRRFIMRCVIGGRCMLRDNEKQHETGNIQDFDGVSLYPSAMSRMSILKGKPQILPDNVKYEDLQKYDGYFVKINVTAVNKHRHFPLLTRKNDDGIREFKNDLLGVHYVDKCTLEDLIEFQKIEFDIVKGYYFEDGRIAHIQGIIKTLFDTRAKEKKNKNPIQVVYKLLMNSIYGKSLLKYDDITTVIKDNEADMLKYLLNNYDTHYETVKLNDCDKYSVKIIKDFDDHFNFPQFGCEVLSMSKRIMNEVMCLAEDEDVDIYYQDTDSMHLKAEGLEKLQNAYRCKYNRELIGTNLGQFHCDFDYKTDNGTTPYSREFIGLGKKSYYDEVVTYNNGVEKINEHFRLKGISNHAVKEKAKNNTIKSIYEDLHKGKKHEFDLMCGGIRFKHEKNKTIHNVSEFKRVLSF